MNSLCELQKTWEHLARQDPLWAICTDAAKRGGGWNLEDFFATGCREIDVVLQHVRSLRLAPDEKGPVLDFGCGVGRLTSALSRYFAECWGVDISPTMIQLAVELNHGNPRCRFRLNQAENLSQFSGEYFGFVYTSIVLQHMETEYVRGYLRELIRILTPGGVLVFQLADRAAPWQRVRNRVQLRRRINRILRREPSHEPRFQMHCLSETEVRQFLASQSVRLVDVKITNSTKPGFNGDLQFLHSEPRRGYVSKQYYVVKTEH